MLADSPSRNLYLLGPVDVSREGTLLRLTDTQVALLSYVAVQNSPQSLSHLQDVLALSSQAALLEVIHQTQATLGAGWLVLEAGFVSLAEDVWVDVYAFLAVALHELEPRFDDVVQTQNAIFDLYYGPLLAGWTADASPEFMRWLTHNRQHLRRLFRQSVLAIVKPYQRSNNWQQIAAVARQALKVDPQNEAFQAALANAREKLAT